MVGAKLGSGTWRAPLVTRTFSTILLRTVVSRATPDILGHRGLKIRRMWYEFLDLDKERRRVETERYGYLIGKS